MKPCVFGSDETPDNSKQNKTYYKIAQNDMHALKIVTAQIQTDHGTDQCPMKSPY